MKLHSDPKLDVRLTQEIEALMRELKISAEAVALTDEPRELLRERMQRAAPDRDWTRDDLALRCTYLRKQKGVRRLRDVLADRPHRAV